MSNPQKNLQPAAPQELTGTLARSGQGHSEPNTLIALLPAGLIAAHFTTRELDAIRSICRDADNELASRMLRDALARAEVKS